MAKDKIIDSLALFVLGVLYTWSITFAVISCTVILHDARVILLYCAVVFGVMSVVMYNRVTMAVSGAVAALTALFMLLGAVLGDGAVAGLFGFMVNTFMFVIGYGSYAAGYGNAVVLSLVVLVALFAAVFMKVLFSYWTLVAFGAAMFALSIISGYFNNDVSFIVFLVCVVALTIMKFNARIWKGVSSSFVFPRIFSAFFIPLSLAVVLAAAIVPVNPGRVELGEFFENNIRGPYYAIREALLFAFEPRYFAFENVWVGSGGGRLGGDVRRSFEFVMDVRTDTAPIYLSGAVHDFYTGYSWVSTRTGFDVYERPEIDPAVLSHWMGYWYDLTLRPLMFLNEGNNAEAFYEFFFEDYMSGMFSGFEFVGEDGDREFAVRRTGADEVFVFQGERAELIHAMRNINVPLFSVAEGSPFSVADMFIVGQFNAGRRAATNRRVIYSEVVVNIRGRRTGSLFLPANFSHVVDFADDRGPRDLDDLRVSPNGVMRVDRTMRRDTQYTMAFFEQSLNVMPFEWSLMARTEPLNRSREGLYEQILDDFRRLAADNALIRDIYGIDPEVFILRFDEGSYSFEYLLEEILIPKAAGARETFTQLPPLLPGRVRELAERITYGYETDIDRATALLRYVSRFPYTLSPGGVPLDRDFVDYFLFDKQTGYCVYFASAFAVLARSIGLPARYMEGYIVTSAPNAGGWRRVDNSTAHAWVEVYFEGHGWRLFEPTPAYLDMEFDPFEGPPYYIDFEDDFFEDDRPGWLPGADEIYDYGEDLDDLWWMGIEEDEVGGGGTALLAYFGAAVAALLGLAALVTVVRAVKMRVYLRKLDESSNNAAAAGYFRLILKYAKFKELEIYGYETPNNYAERVGQKLFFNNEKMFMKDLADVFTKAMYSGKQVSDDEVGVMRIAYEEFMAKMRKELKSVRFVFYRYTLGRV